MNSLEHNEVGSSTLFMMRAAAYLSKVSFSLIVGPREFDGSVLVRRRLLLQSEQGVLSSQGLQNYQVVRFLL